MTGKRVLVVEDNETSQRILTAWLEKFGARPAAAATSQLAFELLRSPDTFDAIIVDLQLPEMDGFSVAEAMRRLPGGEKAEILLLTSVHVPDGDPRIIASRICSSIHKPVRAKQLLEAFNRAFGSRRAAVRRRTRGGDRPDICFPFSAADSVGR